MRGSEGAAMLAQRAFVASLARYNPAPWPEPSTPPRSPMAFPCRPSSRRTPAAGCSGRNGPTTGAWARCPRSRLSPKWPAAIARFEPVTVGVSAAHFEFARAQLPAHMRVVEMSHDDAWMRDVGPTFVTNEQGRDGAASTGASTPGEGLRAGSTFPGTRTTSSRSKVLEIEGCDRYRAPIVNEGGAIHVDGEGTALVTEQVSAQSESQSRTSPRTRSSGTSSPTSACRPSSGWARAWSTMKPAGTSTISPASCSPAPWRCTGPTTSAIRNTRCRTMRSSGSPRRATRAAAGSRVIKLPMPGPLRYTAGRSARACRCATHVRGRLAGMRLAGELREFLHRQRRHRHAAARSAHRQGCRREAQARISGPQGRRRAGARDPVRRRKHSLHHPAGAPMSQRPVPRRDIPDRLRVRPGSRLKLADADADRCFGWDKDKAMAATAENLDAPRRAAVQDVRRRPLRDADRAAGHRWRRQGQHHPARVWRFQPAGLHGHRFQGAERRGAAPRLSCGASTGTHRRGARSRYSTARTTKTC